MTYPAAMRAQVRSSAICRMPGLVLPCTILVSLMLVSGGADGVAAPAYTGGRPLLEPAWPTQVREEHGHDPPLTAARVVGAERDERER